MGVGPLDPEMHRSSFPDEFLTWLTVQAIFPYMEKYIRKRKFVDPRKNCAL
jgi:hypothetical protein